MGGACLRPQGREVLWVGGCGGSRNCELGLKERPPLVVGRLCLSLFPACGLLCHLGQDCFLSGPLSSAGLTGLVQTSPPPCALPTGRGAAWACVGLWSLAARVPGLASPTPSRLALVMLLYLPELQSPSHPCNTGIMTVVNVNVSKPFPTVCESLMNGSYHLNNGFKRPNLPILGQPPDGGYGSAC